MTTIQASLKENQGFVYRKLIDRQKKVKPTFQVNHLVRTADLRDKRFLKSDTTNWSYKLFKITENFNDAVPSYKIDDLKKDIIKLYLKRQN